MAQKRTYLKCPKCHRYIPYLQPLCDCGYHFSGNEEKYKTCSKCGSFYIGTRLLCDCGHILLFDKDEVTTLDINAAYQSGFLAGIKHERRRLEKELETTRHSARADGIMFAQQQAEAEWAQFFKDAQLKDTITGKPIQTREDFARWKATFEAEKKKRECMKAARYLAETEDGFVVSVPEDKLEAWQKAQEEPSAPLNKAERLVRDKVIQRHNGRKERPEDEKDP